ncbi:hypothetical protein L7F22_051097 [Adiantum nelumboides]|nr:hypothetical protein [Adiantum nelumboides]
MCNIEEDKVLQFETVALDYISNLDAIVRRVLTSSTQKLNMLSELRASLQQKKESLLRWTPSPFTRIQHTKLCMSRQDFHEVYNLSLDGVENPHYMDVTEKDRLSVLTVLQTKGQKVKLQTIRSELDDKFMMLYQMVYKELLVNGECAAWFAKAFAFENCQRADLSLDKSKYRVAWAVVVEDSVTQLEAHNKTSLDVRSGSEIPCRNVEIGRHAKDTGEDPALPRVIDLTMVGVEGLTLDTAVDASLNTEVPVHRVSIDGTVPTLDKVADASLNNEVPAHRAFAGSD